MASRTLEGTAAVMEGRPVDQPGDSTESWLDVVIDFYGSRRYELLLEVHVPGREPYPAKGDFKVPNRAGVIGRGVELPVRVGERDPGDIEIDWKGYRADPRRKQMQKAAKAWRAQAQSRAYYEASPSFAATVRANNRVAAAVWAEAVKHGSLTRVEFDRQVDGEVAAARMLDADATAARALLD